MIIILLATAQKATANELCLFHRELGKWARDSSGLGRCRRVAGPPPTLSSPTTSSTAIPTAAVVRLKSDSSKSILVELPLHRWGKSRLLAFEAVGVVGGYVVEEVVLLVQVNLRLQLLCQLCCDTTLVEPTRRRLEIEFSATFDTCLHTSSSCLAFAHAKQVFSGSSCALRLHWTGRSDILDLRGWRRSGLLSDSSGLSIGGRGGGDTCRAPSASPAPRFPAPLASTALPLSATTVSTATSSTLSAPPFSTTIGSFGRGIARRLRSPLFTLLRLSVDPWR